MRVLDQHTPVHSQQRAPGGRGYSQYSTSKFATMRPACANSLRSGEALADCAVRCIRWHGWRASDAVCGGSKGCTWHHFPRPLSLVEGGVVAPLFLSGMAPHLDLSARDSKLPAIIILLRAQHVQRSTLEQDPLEITLHMPRPCPTRAETPSSQASAWI